MLYNIGYYGQSMQQDNCVCYLGNHEVILFPLGCVCAKDHLLLGKLVVDSLLALYMTGD